jgi:hypothetical protein
MVTEPLHRLLPGAVTAAALLQLAACDQWSLLVNSDGVLSISIVTDGEPLQRFRVRARESNGTSRDLQLPASGTLTLRSEPGGELELTLIAPEGCQVTAPNPRTVRVTADATASVTFEAHCGS